MENGNQKNDHAVIEIEESEKSIGVAALASRLKESRNLVRIESQKAASIHRVPPSLRGISEDAIYPEIVSIGPYHRGTDSLLDFESYKRDFVVSFLERMERSGKTLEGLWDVVARLEKKARSYYSEPIPMSSDDFIEMLLVDGCFILELFHHVCQSEVERAVSFISMPWLIPVLCRDLLKLENQIPFIVLEMIFIISRPAAASNEGRGDPLVLLALKFFNLVLPRNSEILKRKGEYGNGKHLLELFYLSFYPLRDPSPPTKSLLELFCLRFSPQRDPSPVSLTTCFSNESVQSAVQLELSWIKFRPQKASNLLDIHFRKGKRLLEIPPVTINEFTTTIFINCVALEQCCGRDKSHRSFFSAYIAFMSCLVNSVKDVTLLCSAGVITSYSQDDYRVARLFKKLGENVSIKCTDTHFGQLFRDVDYYYNGFGATMMRRYFSSTWALISVFSAFILLAMTGIQTIMAILSYLHQP